MRICAAWLLKHAARSRLDDSQRRPWVFMSGRCSLTRILRSLGRGFLVPTRFFTFARVDQTAARRDAAKSALENAQRLQPNSSETLLALGYYQYWVLRDYGAAKTTFESRQQNVTWQQRGPIRPRPNCPTRGTLGSKHCLLRASPRPGPT